MLQRGPSTAADVIAFIAPVEGELDGRLPVALTDRTIEPGFGGNEAHPAVSQISIVDAGRTSIAAKHPAALE